MVLSDYHIHTLFSDDSKATMAEMARAEAEMGMTHICFTDHVEDCCHDDPVSYLVHGDYFATMERYLKEASEIREEYRGKMDIRIGIELGGANHDPELAKNIAFSDGLDFIIGSVHNLKGRPDFFAMDYNSEEECRGMIREYLVENIETAELGYCDVLGHVGFANKFMYDKGYDVKITEFDDELNVLLRTLVEKGVGLEINTSGLRRKINETAPTLNVVKRYREMGGEIITVGSDGHVPKYAGYGAQTGFEILREAGFKYVTVFEERKPKFLNI